MATIRTRINGVEVILALATSSGIQDFVATDDGTGIMELHGTSGDSDRYGIWDTFYYVQREFSTKNVTPYNDN